MAFIPSKKVADIDAAIDRYENPNPDNAQPWGGRIATPTTKQLATFASPIARTCNDCRYFNHKGGQQLLFKENGLSTIVHDYGWKQRHLCADPKDLGQCERRDALTAGYYVACEEYRSK